MVPPVVHPEKKAQPANAGIEKRPDLPKKEVVEEPNVAKPPLKAEASPKGVNLPKEGVTLKGYTGPVGRLAFSRDGIKLMSSSFDNTVKVWISSRRTLRVRRHERLHRHTNLAVIL